MAKEMIVSVNGREKKIAILEDGKVTEFYIERGEENSGVVGNIYKGRVQRVLPGMQSAFVEIGLERDAFLYVSDFFDEEEEFERIVMEKAKKADVPTAERAAADKLQRARLEREQAMEAAQERAEPIFAPKKTQAAPDEAIEPETDADGTDDETDDIFAELESEIGDAARIAVGDDDDDDEPASGGFELIETITARIPQLLPISDGEEVLTPFVSDDSSFERIVDDEDGESEPGESFKEARVQERLTDQVRAIEFEIEPVAPMEVGSLKFDGGAASGLQRIEDGEDDLPAMRAVERGGDEAETNRTTEKTSRRGRRGKRDRDKTAETADQPVESQPAEETALATSETATESTETAGEKRGRRGAGAGKKQAAGEPKEETARQKRAGSKRERGNSDEAKMQSENDDQPKNQPNESENGESIETINRENESVESDSTATRDGSQVETVDASSQNEIDTEVAAMQYGEDSGVSSPLDAETAEYGDGDASVDDFGAFRSEMAVRRGGRRRRPGSGGNNRAGARGGQDGDAGGDDQNETEDSDIIAETEIFEIEEAPEPPPIVQPARFGNGRGGRERTERQREPRGDRSSSGAEQPGRAERPERSERPERAEQRGEQQRNERPERSERGGRRAPTITDLLREGQEILVQIAKEPIAKKGARITSHIALPGRFLVYMPTIDHAGVSRKIESSGERARLRTLIQKIRAEEDVPSGGFIVRTAGIGISEQDLRDDARYLVRTWTDIRKTAEKAKSPALVHQDLDLVERILRDQLSDEFAAIRVDDEAEYLRVVEFINRIQPRMTNRVKLYTRDEPIMETYGVQEEIDKAVKPRVWLRSGGYLVINQTEALVSIDVNTGKFVGGKGGNNRLEDTITKTNMEAVDEIARQIRLRDLGGIIVLDLIDMEDRRNRQKVLQALQEALQGDKSPTKVLSFNDFGLIVMTRKRVKQSLERTLCAPCHYCEGAGLIKSPQTVCYEILAEARRLSKGFDDGIKQTTLRVHPEIARALRSSERDVLTEIEDYLGAVDVTSDPAVHQEQYDFALI